MDERQRAAGRCIAATGGAVLLGYVAYELLKFATGQAIVAGSPLPALTVFGLLCFAGYALYSLKIED